MAQIIYEPGDVVELIDSVEVPYEMGGEELELLTKSQGGLWFAEQFNGPAIRMYIHEKWFRRVILNVHERKT